MNLFRVNKHPRVLKTLKALAPEDWRVVVTESAQRMNGVTTTLLSKRLERIVKSLVKLDQKTWRDVVAVSAWPAGYAKQWGTHGRGARDQRMFLSGVERYTLCDSLTDAELQDAALYAETFDQGKAHDTTQCDRALHFLALARGNKKVAAKLMGVARSTYYGYLNACPPELSVAGGRGAFIQPSDVPVRKALDIAAIINTNGTGTHEVWERMDAWVAAQGLRAVLDTVKRIYASNGSKWSTGEENWWISQLVDKS